jgi:hypothetical protein
MLAIAHRGASGYAPENTFAAFRKALAMGAGFVETDLQLSRDAPSWPSTCNSKSNYKRPRRGDLTLADLEKWMRVRGLAVSRR